MGRSQNWSFVSRAIRDGQVVTPELRAELHQRARDKAAAKAAARIERDKRRAEREARRTEVARTQPEREKLQAARDARRAAYRAEEAALIALPFGGSLIVTRYSRTSQVGMLCQRLKDLHGAFFTCKAIAGKGVRFERLYPPHAAPAGNDPNGDLL